MTICFCELTSESQPVSDLMLWESVNQQWIHTYELESNTDLNQHLFL